ncbi:UDP-glucose:glycoprotein glucosyltransferase [Aureococcus anophagefferens]|uniref:UDP-glucose:glycoprotein glucosyltransferase n=1 Tax=Aureococcus anophagefferens TaxID=44056 RepID=A0ABR1FQV1_AURAN
MLMAFASLVAVAATLLAQASARSIEITLTAPWKSSAASPLVEAAEFFAEEGAAEFWAFLEAVGGGFGDAKARKTIDGAFSGPYASATHEEVGAIALDYGEESLPPLRAALLKLSLATREYAPRVEAHRALAASLPACDGATSFRAVVSSPGHADRVACAPGDVAAAVAAAEAPVCGGDGCDDATHLLGSEVPYPGGAPPSAPTVQLVGDVSAPEFPRWHAACKALADAGAASYFLRHGPPAAAALADATYLQGFGANLDIKNMEYRNFDDEKKSEDGEAEVAPEDVRFEEGAEVGGVVFSTLHARRPGLGPELKKLEDALLEEASASSGELKMWRTRDLALQATAAILDAPDGLKKLRELASDFPSHASALSTLKVREELRTGAAYASQFALQSGMGQRALLFLGGAAHDLSSPTLSVHGMLKAVRDEVRELGALDALDVGSVDTKQQLLKLAERGQGRRRAAVKRVDLLSGSKGAVCYANNLEKDAMYKRWPSNVDQLLYPSWNLASIAKNLYTAVFFLDASTVEALEAVHIASLMMRQGYPVRVAFVLGDAADAADDDDAGDFASAFEEDAAAAGTFDLDDAGQAAVVAAYVAARRRRGSAAGNGDAVAGRDVAALAALARAARGPRCSWEFLATLALNAGEEDAKPGFETSKRAGAKKDGWKALRGEDFPGLKDVALTVDAQRACASAKGVSFAGSMALNGIVMDGLDVQGALLPLLGEEQRRMAQLVHRGAIDDGTKNVYGKALLQGAGRQEPEEPTEEDELDDMFAAMDPYGDPYGDPYADEPEPAGAASRARCASPSPRRRGDRRRGARRPSDGEACGAGEACLFANGRKVPGSYVRSVPDVSLVVDLEAPMAAAVEDVLGEAASDAATLAARVFLGKRASRPRNDVEGVLNEMLEQAPEVGILTLESGGGGDDDSSTKPAVTALLDPLSEAAQRAAPILLALRDVLGLKIKICLQPDPELSEVPLQKYYRFSLDAESVGASSRPPKALFSGLPKTHVLTLRVDTPESWDVQMVTAAQDPDNLRCEGPGPCGDDASSGELSKIGYALKSLVVMGQCYDVVHRKPPNGLQIELVDRATGESRHDTLVMQNLGYFQLRAGPGYWKVDLANGTKSRELYETVEASDRRGFGYRSRRRGVGNVFDAAAPASDGVAVVVDDFEASAHQLRVRKRAGMEDVELLGDKADDDDDSGGGYFSGFFSKKAPKANDDLDTVHVFSLATGALYERMLKIMMLSVRKRTSGPVKFWLFENYLTPEFKNDAQKLAAAKGFDVAYVTYKWPEWLRRQTVKQRIIWGYKILFLDVLFPLDVKKVIYVDADQVVRGDLRELWDTDMGGKPYGYVPFCDSRPETLGYQFWRSGYWKDHLRGKPYHISALYVVDLDVFRKHAIGDELRGVYDQLSRDPNSLSNLDQDLPNYAQNSIPIHSLPQDWLWCESWCSDKSKETAKTIDLCNNPEHKENKLTMAKRIIDGLPLFPESWVQLDDEVKNATAA